MTDDIAALADEFGDGPAEVRRDDLAVAVGALLRLIRDNKSDQVDTLIRAYDRLHIALVLSKTDGTPA